MIESPAMSVNVPIPTIGQILWFFGGLLVGGAIGIIMNERQKKQYLGSLQTIRDMYQKEIAQLKDVLKKTT